MTWVGFLVIFYCLLSYAGSAMQYKAAKTLKPSAVRKGFRIGVGLTVILTTVILWGTLAIGTGHL